VRKQYIPDFSNWKNHNASKKAFDRPEQDLRASAREKQDSDRRECGCGWQTAPDISGFLPKAATGFKDEHYCPQHIIPFINLRP